MTGLARLFIAVGLLFLLLGGIVFLFSRLGLPLGRLPGDIAWRGKNSAVYFPITTCIILSVLLSLLLYVIEKFRR